MKIAVMNFSGNVGKTTVARHLLAPRMKDAPVISVESINDDGTEDEAIRGKQFGELMEALAVLDAAVVDVGSSNAEEFVHRMTQYRGSHEDFDFFVIPTVAKTKQMRDTVSTIDALSGIGVPAKKIRLLFNMVDVDEAPERIFSALFKYAEAEKSFTLRPAAVIQASEIYEKLRDSGQGISEVLKDATDLKEQLKAAIDPAEKVRISRLIGIKRLAAGVTEDLDAVYKALLK